MSTVDGELLAKQLQTAFIETSALSGYNVEAAFVNMTSNIKKSIDRRGLKGVKTTTMKKSGEVKISGTEARQSITDQCGGLSCSGARKV